MSLQRIAMHPAARVCAAVLSLAMACLVIAADIDWQQAAQRIRRLAPADFPDAPRAIIAELVKRGCTIPQTLGSNRPQNLIQGAFARAGSSDWAALCSRQGVSSIVIFWESGNPCPAEIRRSEDSSWLQDMGADLGAGFSRLITTVGKQYIEDHHRAYGGPTPPLIDHDGIDEAFIEKGSSVHYCHQGEWLLLTGSD